MKRITVMEVAKLGWQAQPETFQPEGHEAARAYEQAQEDDPEVDHVYDCVHQPTRALYTLAWATHHINELRRELSQLKGEPFEEAP